MQIRNSYKVLKCGAEGGWKRSVGPFVGEGRSIKSVREEMTIQHTIKTRKASWIGHILRSSCLLSHVIEGKREGRRARRRKKLLDGLKENTGYWKVKEEAVDLSVWRTIF